jgi:hypothetical protein
MQSAFVFFIEAVLLLLELEGTTVIESDCFSFRFRIFSPLLISSKAG